MKIITHYWAKPVPSAEYDWEAVDDDTYDWEAVDDDTYYGSGPIGHGTTEEEAIQDLKDQLEAREDDSAWLEFTERTGAHIHSDKE